MKLSPSAFGLAAEFENPALLLSAAKKLRAAGYVRFETYSPYPIHGMDKAMGLRDSRLGWIVFCAACLGLLGGFGLQAWSSVLAYPIIISGKPLLSTEAFVPVTFEVVILFSAFSTVIGMLLLNKLPLFYHPLFKHKTFHRASSSAFFVSIEAADPQFEAKKTSDFLASLGGKNIELVEE